MFENNKKNMKKFFVLTLGAVMIISMFGFVGSAEAIDDAPTSCIIRANTGIDECPDPGETALFEEMYPDDEGVIGSLCCVFSAINYVATIAFALLMALVVLFILVGAYNFLTAAGEETKVTAGRNYILYALIGLVVASFAWAIPQIARMVVGI